MFSTGMMGGGMKKITDEIEYAKALRRIEQLMFNVIPGSSEGEELESLSKMVENYENENYLYINTNNAPRGTENYTIDERSSLTSQYLVKKKKPI